MTTSLKFSGLVHFSHLLTPLSRLRFFFAYNSIAHLAGLRSRLKQLKQAQAQGLWRSLQHRAPYLRRAPTNVLWKRL
jgi:hypothetical protein